MNPKMVLFRILQWITQGQHIRHQHTQTRKKGTFSALNEEICTYTALKTYYFVCFETSHVYDRNTSLGPLVCVCVCAAARNELNGLVARKTPWRCYFFSSKQNANHVAWHVAFKRHINFIWAAKIYVTDISTETGFDNLWVQRKRKPKHEKNFSLDHQP